jgi:hypothetical protein
VGVFVLKVSVWLETIKKWVRYISAVWRPFLNHVRIIFLNRWRCI